MQQKLKIFRELSTHFTYIQCIPISHFSVHGIRVWRLCGQRARGVNESEVGLGVNTKHVPKSGYI